MGIFDQERRLYCSKEVLVERAASGKLFDNALSRHRRQ